MRVLLLGTQPQQEVKVHKNATDAFIEAGCVNLIQAAFPNAAIDKQRCPNHEPAKPEHTTHSGKYDLVAVMGSPWLWEGMANSHKYKNTLKYLKDHKDTPSILMGGGSAYDFPHMSLNGHSLVAAREFFEHFTSLVVREELAGQDLKRLGLIVNTFACPAYFGIDDMDWKPKKGKGGAVVWAAPEHTLGRRWWEQNPKMLKTIKDTVKSKAEDEGYKVYLTAKSVENDRATAEALGLKIEGVFENREDVVRELNKYENIISFRVHNAVPAQVMGKKVELVPVDSRAHTFKPTLTEAGRAAWKLLWIDELQNTVKNG